MFVFSQNSYIEISMKVLGSGAFGPEGGALINGISASYKRNLPHPFYDVRTQTDGTIREPESSPHYAQKSADTLVLNLSAPTAAPKD
jgi:hypothetical protein